MPPAATNGDDDLMIAALSQLAANKLDMKQFARDIYGEEEPARGKIESARLRWKAFIKRLEEKTGRVIMVAATPKKEGAGAGKAGGGKGRKRKVEVEDEGEDGGMGGGEDGGGGENEVLTPTPSPKKKKQRTPAKGKVKEEVKEEVPEEMFDFAEEAFAGGVDVDVHAGQEHGHDFDFDVYA
jgi:hypothetical protein